MITDFFLSINEEYDLENMLFEKDGGTCHTTRANMVLLYQQATKIMRFDTMRVFLWGYAKDLVYADKALTLEH